MLIDVEESRPMNDSVHHTWAPLSKMSWVIIMLPGLEASRFLLCFASPASWDDAGLPVN